MRGRQPIWSRGRQAGRAFLKECEALFCSKMRPRLSPRCFSTSRNQTQERTLD